MGNSHNLFGVPNEAQIAVGPDGRAHVAKIIPGSRVGDMLTFARYDHRQVAEGFQRQLAARVAGGELPAETAERLAAEYAAALQGTTYLE
jgi:arginine decarboxylase